MNLLSEGEADLAMFSVDTVLAAYPQVQASR